MKEENEDHKAATAFVNRVRDTATQHNRQQARRAPTLQPPAGITINRPSRCTIVIGGEPVPRRQRNSK